MQLYSKYIAKQLVHATVLIAISLTSIVWLLQALRYIDFIVNQGVSVALFVKLTLLLVPMLLLVILPPAFFCAIIFIYNKLKIDSELVVMQSMGLSKWKLAEPALKVGLSMMVIAYSIALYFQPVSMHAFREMQVFLRNNYVSILLQEGVFSNPVEGLTVFIRERYDDGTLKGILVQDNRKEGSAVTMMADKGMLVQTPSGPRFLLEDGNRQEIRDGKLSFLNYDSYTLDISLYTGVSRGSARDPQELFLHELLTDNPELSDKDANKQLAELHQRLLWPAYIPTLALIAMAFLLSGQFNRRSNWKRITAASTVTAFTLFAFASMKGAIVTQPDIIPAMYIFWLAITGGAIGFLLHSPRVQEAAA